MPIRVAIVEDNLNNARKLEEFLERYQKENHFAIQVQCFLNGEAFLKNFRKNWELILLDIEMPGMSGLETAKRIRTEDKGAEIIFVTNIAEYAMEGYQYEASDYILKPLNYSEFYMKIGKILGKIDRQKSEYLVLENRSKLSRIRLSSIIYVETRGHYLIFHTTEETIETTGCGNLGEVEEQLKDKGFYRCSHSALVNLQYVYDIADVCILKDRTRIPISRGRKKEMKARMMKFLAGE